jgi:MYXO-CTERM domain-containing protein
LTVQGAFSLDEPSMSLPAAWLARARRLALLALGLGSLLLFLLFVAWVPLLPGNLYTPLVNLGSLTHPTWQSAVRFLFLLVGLFALYALGYRLVAQGAAGVRTVFVLAGACSLVLLLAYPATAADVFGYAAQGRQLAFAGANPFQVSPSGVASNARVASILPFLAFRHEPSQYGPLWTILEADLAHLAGGHLLAEILLFKGLAVAAHLGGAALVLAIGRRLTPSREQALAGAYLYACNPLLLWESAANAHNDGAMALGVLAAVWLLARRRHTLVLPALALGALIKLSALAIAPLLVIVLWRRDRRATAIGLALALGLVVVFYRPFWFGPGTLTALGRDDLFTTSFAASLLRIVQPKVGPAIAPGLALLTSLTLLALLYVPLIRRALWTRTTLQAIGLCYLAMLAFMLFGLTWFQPWYATWVIALGACLPTPARRREAMLFGLGTMAVYLVFHYLWNLTVLAGQHDLLRHLAFLLVVGPFGVGWAIGAWQGVVARAVAAGWLPRPLDLPFARRG